MTWVFLFLSITLQITNCLTISIFTVSKPFLLPNEALMICMQRLPLNQNHWALHYVWHLKDRSLVSLQSCNANFDMYGNLKHGKGESTGLDYEQGKQWSGRLQNLIGYLHLTQLTTLVSLMPFLTTWYSFIYTTNFDTNCCKHYSTRKQLTQNVTHNHSTGYHLRRIH